MKNHPLLLILILTPFVFSFAFGLDIYIPIIPQMTAIFDTTPSMVQLTMSLFLFVTGAGQLLIGPLSDRWGRKPIFYLASLLYAAGSLCCAFAPSIAWFIFFRIVSGFGACGMLVTSFAVVRDLYSSDKSAKIYSYLNGAVGISPTFAPILGGYLAVTFGWQSVFFSLAFLGCAAFLITSFFIQETHVEPSSVSAVRYLPIIQNRQFLVFAILAGLAESVFFCFFSISPFIIIGLHGVPTEEFGFYFATFGLVIALAGFASGLLIEKFGIYFTLKIGIALMLIGGALMLLCYQCMPMTLPGFLVPMVIACTGSMFLVGGSASLALEPFGEIAGTAAAAFGAFEFGISSFVGSLLMLFPVTSTLPYGVFIVILGSLCLLLFYNYKRHMQK